MGVQRCGPVFFSTEYFSMIAYFFDRVLEPAVSAFKRGQKKSVENFSNGFTRRL